MKIWSLRSQSHGHWLRQFRHASRSALIVAIVTLTLQTFHCAFGQQPLAISRRMLHGHVPAVVSREQPAGRLAANKQMKLLLGLPLRNQDALTNLLQQLYDPASPSFHHFLTPAEFTARFGPTEQQYQSVIAFAQASGFTVTGTHPGRTLVDVTANVATIEKAFNVKMQTYRHPTENRIFFSPDTEPSVNASLPILAISGLNNFQLPHPMIKLKGPLTRITAATTEKKLEQATPFVGSAPDGSSYLGYDFRAAYAPDVNITGTGQSVGLLEFDSGFFQSDITAYEQLAGLPDVPVVARLLDGYDGGPGFGNDEVSLDIEMAIAMAPGLTQVVVYEGSLVDSILTAIADDAATVKQIGASWGYGIDGNTDPIFLQFATQGQSFFNASGDSDAYTPGTVYPPSDDPNIIVVGGTTLSTSGPGGSWVSEKVWNWGGGAGSSGGISVINAIPSWQQGIDMTANHGSPTFRNLPDVALTADAIWITAEDGAAGSVGGTSAATPLWAAFTALINQQAVNNGNSTVGFLNPAIYSIGKGEGSVAYTNVFHDITKGNNYWSSSPTNFPAVTGYDLCTGWGTPIGQATINAFAGASPGSGLLQFTINPPSGATLISATNQTLLVNVSDVSPFTNATVVATVSGTNLIFLNEGKGVYSAAYQVPTTAGSIAMTISATTTNLNETGITNVVSYTIVAPPANDNFVNATKVPATGATYLSNNRFATIETNEPVEAGVSTRAASLWWSWAPTVSTNVFVDTTGSTIDTVLGVYTGLTLESLTEVASTNDVGTSKQAYLNFNATAGTTYRIAVASSSTNSLGSLRLAVSLGAQPDITPPNLAVVTPLSGVWVSNKIIMVSGTATDPGPNASGVNQVLVKVNHQWSFVTNTLGAASWSCFTALKPGLNILVITATDSAGNVSVPVNIQVTYVEVTAPNDLFANAIGLTNNSGSVSVGTTNATKEFGEPAHAGNAGGKSVWWSFTPASNGVLSLNTTNSTFDTLLGLYTGPDVAHLTTIAYNDDAYEGVPGGYSEIVQAVRSNVTYYVAVDGYGGAFGTAWLNYSFVQTPVFHLVTSSSAGGELMVTSTNPVGGVVMMPGIAGDFASNAVIALTASSYPYYSFGAWAGSASSSANPLTVVVTSDLSITAQFQTTPYTDGFESGNLSHLNWTTSGDAPWYVQTNMVAAGVYAARSGIISDSQTSSLILTTNFSSGPGSFDYYVSSETNFDYLSFYMDGVLLKKWSGQIGWENYIFPISAGTHTLIWTYSKDPDLSMGLDAGFIDDVNLPFGVSIDNSSPAHLQLFRQSDGSFVLDLLGQTNQQYVIQVSTNLLNWQSISTNTATGGVIQFPDPSSSSNSVRFYRALASPQ